MNRAKFAKKRDGEESKLFDGSCIQHGRDARGTTEPPPYHGRPGRVSCPRLSAALSPNSHSLLTHD